MSVPNDRRRRRRRTILIVLAAAGLSLFTFAFTAANIVPGSKAGDGAGTITGYTVSNVQYTLDATKPANIESVAFALDSAAGTVKAKLIAASGTYTDCANTGGNNWSCNIEPDRPCSRRTSCG